MSRSRISLYYLAGYLLPTGLGLLLAPGPVLRLLRSTGTYGDVMPRFAGAVIFALGILIVQIIRLQIDTLHPTAIAARIFLSACMVGLYLYVRDPFFLVVLVVILIGLTWTSVGYWLDRTRPATRMAPNDRSPLGPRP